MASTLLKKSITDLTRRKARAVFAVLTLAIAVASVGIFAASPLMDRAMQDEVRASRLADLTLQTKPLVVTAAQLAALGRLPNVEGVQALSVVQTRVWIGERRQKALVVGVPDYGRQPVDRVTIASGLAPRAGTVLTDAQNASGGRYKGVAGDRIRVVGVGDRTHSLRVTGVGRNLEWSQMGVNGDFVVLYATPATAAELAGQPGYSLLAFRLSDTSAAAANRTVDDVRGYLRANTSFARFSDLPSIREPGTYPGKELFDQLASLMNVFTVLALLAASVLVANTMGTLIGEQRREIGMMKAIGGTRRQIRRVYLLTALLLGAIAAVLGVGLGVVISNAIVGYFGSSFFAISPGWAVSVPVVVASLVLGLVGPPLMALPAIRRGTRVPVREALEEVPSLEGGARIVDKALRRVAFLPRTAQIGVRSVTRRTRRSLATVVQIALAVGTLIGVLALMNSVTSTTEAAWNQLHYDLDLNTVVGKPLDTEADRLIRTTPGVAIAQPVLTNMVKADGKDASLWGLPPRPMFDQKVVAGRWFTAGEETGSAARDRDREEHRQGDRGGRRRQRHDPDRVGPGQASRRRDHRDPDGERPPLPDAALDAPGDPPQPGQRQRLLGPHQLDRPRPDRPYDDSARGSPRRGRLLRRHQHQVRRPGPERRREPPDQLGDRHPRLPDRRDLAWSGSSTRSR